MAVVLAAHEQEDPLNYSVSVASGIAYGNEELWGRVLDLLQGHMPLNNLVCHRHGGRQLLETLHVQLSLVAQTPAGPPKRPAFQYARPYVHVFLVDAATVTTYTHIYRETLHGWVAANQEAHKEWIILYAPERTKAEVAAAKAALAAPAPPPAGRSRKGSSWSWLGIGGGASASADPHAQAVAAASSARDAVWSRICKDFGSSPKLALGCHTLSYDKTRRREMTVRPLPRLARLSQLCGDASAAAVQAEWNTFKFALETCVTCCLDARLTFLERQVAACEALSASPGWDFMTLFLLRECLAFVYSAMRLPELALMQYNELRRFFGESAQAQAPFLPLPPTLTSHLPTRALAGGRGGAVHNAAMSHSGGGSDRRSTWGGIWPFKGGDKSGKGGGSSARPPSSPSAVSTPQGGSTASSNAVPALGGVKSPRHFAPFAPPGPHHGGMFGGAPATSSLDDGGLIIVSNFEAKHDARMMQRRIREAQSVLSANFNVYSGHGLLDEPVATPPGAEWGPLPQCPRRHLFDVSLKDKPYRERISSKSISSLDFWRYCLARQGSLMQRTKQHTDLAARAVHYLQYVAAVTQLHLAQQRVRPVDAAAWMFCSAVDAVEVTNKASNGVRMPRLELDGKGGQGGLSAAEAEVQYSELSDELQALASSVFSVRQQQGLVAAPADGYTSPGGAAAQLTPAADELMGHTEHSAAQKSRLSLLLAELIVLARFALCRAVSSVLTAPAPEAAGTPASAQGVSSAPQAADPAQSVRSASARTLLSALRQDVAAAAAAAAAAASGSASRDPPPAVALVAGHASRILVLKLTVMGIGHLSLAGHGHSAAQLLLEASALWVGQGGYDRALPLLANQLPLLATHNWRSIHAATLVLAARAELGVCSWRRALCSLWRLLGIVTPLVTALQSVFFAKHGTHKSVPADELESMFRHTQFPCGLSELGPMEVFGGGLLRVWRDLLHVCSQLRVVMGKQQAAVTPETLSFLAAAPVSRSQEAFPGATDAVAALWGGVAAVGGLLAAERTPPSTPQSEEDDRSHPSASLHSAVTVAARPLMRSAVFVSAATAPPAGIADVHGGDDASVQVALRLAGGQCCAPKGDCDAAGNSMGVPVEGFMVHLKRVPSPSGAGHVSPTSALAASMSGTAAESSAPNAAGFSELGASWTDCLSSGTGGSFAGLFDATSGAWRSGTDAQPLQHTWQDESNGGMVCAVSVSRDAVLLSAHSPATAAGCSSQPERQLFPGVTTVFRVQVPAGVLPSGAWDVRSVRVLTGRPPVDPAGQPPPTFGCCLLDQFPTVLHAVPEPNMPHSGRVCTHQEVLSGACSLRNADSVSPQLASGHVAPTGALALFRSRQGSALLPQLGTQNVRAESGPLLRSAGDAPPPGEVAAWHSSQLAAEAAAAAKAAQRVQAPSDAPHGSASPRLGVLALHRLGPIADAVFGPPPPQVDPAGTVSSLFDAASTPASPSWLPFLYAGHNDALSSTLALAPVPVGGMGGGALAPEHPASSLDSGRGFGHSFAATPTATPRHAAAPSGVGTPEHSTRGVRGVRGRRDSAAAVGDSDSDDSYVPLRAPEGMRSGATPTHAALRDAFRTATGVALPGVLCSGAVRTDGGFSVSPPSVSTARHQLVAAAGTDQLVRAWVTSPAVKYTPPSNDMELGTFLSGPPFFLFSGAPAPPAGRQPIRAKWAAIGPQQDSPGNYALQLHMHFPVSSGHGFSQWALLRLPAWVVPAGKQCRVTAGGDTREAGLAMLVADVWTVPLPACGGEVLCTVPCWVACQPRGSRGDTTPPQHPSRDPPMVAVLRSPCSDPDLSLNQEHISRHVWAAGLVAVPDLTPPAAPLHLEFPGAAAGRMSLPAAAVRSLVQTEGGDAAWGGGDSALVVPCRVSAAGTVRVRGLVLGVRGDAGEGVHVLDTWAPEGTDGQVYTGDWVTGGLEGVQGVLLGGTAALVEPLRRGEAAQVAWAVSPSAVGKLEVLAIVQQVDDGERPAEVVGGTLIVLATECDPHS